MNIRKCKLLNIYCDYSVIYSSAASLIEHRRESRLTNSSKSHFYKRMQNSRSDFTGIEHESDHNHSNDVPKFPKDCTGLGHVKHVRGVHERHLYHLSELPLAPHLK